MKNKNNPQMNQWYEATPEERANLLRKRKERAEQIATRLGANEVRRIVNIFIEEFAFILWVVHSHNPENNSYPDETLQAIVKRYPEYKDWLNRSNRELFPHGESLVSASSTLLIKVFKFQDWSLKNLQDKLGELYVAAEYYAGKDPRWHRLLDPTISSENKGRGIISPYTSFEEWKRAIFEWPKYRKTFAIPSHPLMFTLLAMFAGKPDRIPRKLLEKTYKERTPQEQKEADKFISSIIKAEGKTTYDERGRESTRTSSVALVCDSPKVEAEARITDTLFSNDPSFREGALAMYIKRTYGAEGLRHLLGLIIGLEEHFRQGYFNWTVNEHLERLGYKRKQGGAFDPKLKRAATEIVKIFTSLFIMATDKKAKKTVITGEKFFSIDGFRIELFDKVIIDEELKLRATDFWYKNAFEPKDGHSPKYTKLLKKIAQENHRNHPLTIYLAPLFAIFWRINPNRTLSIKSLMEWCNLDVRGHNRLRDLKDLEAELNYMKQNGYLGGWQNDGASPLPSNCPKPFNCVLTLSPPSWLKEEFKHIETKKKRYVLESSHPVLTKEELRRLLDNTGLTQGQFANNLGISRQYINYILSGKREITQKLSIKIRETFGYTLPV